MPEKREMRIRDRLEPRPPLDEILARVVAITASQLALPIKRVLPTARLVQDLGCDSLEMIELMMAVEEAFAVSLPAPNQLHDQSYKQVFTREGFTVADMAELVHLRWGQVVAVPIYESGARPEVPRRTAFAQLGGRLRRKPSVLYEAIGESKGGLPRYRRMTDGMPCVQLPGGSVDVGSNCVTDGSDAGPLHKVNLEPFLIDEEAVSTTAYCRFLNSIGAVDQATLEAWFLLREGARRRMHQVLARPGANWQPVNGTAEWPMVLVSWFGANAYTLWANNADWRTWREDSGRFLPSESQWEYAARGPIVRAWPWGDEAPAVGAINAGVHRRGQRYTSAGDLPLLPVHALAAVSPFGLLQMAGNVWQWCRDWYDPAAYSRAANSEAPACDTGLRSERGGSWVGPVDLARASYRRGRAPDAKGRCLGFRCIGAAPALR